MKHNLLFVDDQEEVLTLVERVFSKEHELYNLFFARSGNEALEILANNEIDVIVTDMMMPDMSGLDLIKLVKVKYPSVVRIVLSGFNQIPTILDAVNSGDLFRYITKPWRVNTEAKTIIQQAVEYSDLIKMRDLYSCSLTDITIKPSRLKKMLEVTKTKFVVLNDSNEVYLKSDDFEETDLENLEDYSVTFSQNGYQIYLKK